MNSASIQWISQSIKIYIAPPQDPYSEALTTQAKRKRAVLRRWWNWEQALFGRCLRSIGSPFHVCWNNHRKRTGLHCSRVVGLPLPGLKPNWLSCIALSALWYASQSPFSTHSVQCPVVWFLCNSHHASHLLFVCIMLSHLHHNFNSKHCHVLQSYWLPDSIEYAFGTNLTLTSLSILFSLSTCE